MPLLRASGELSEPIEKARRSLRLLSITAVLGSVLAAGVGLAGTVLLSRALHEANTAAGALRLHGEIDMMHDALRADIFTAATGMSFAIQDFEQHVELLEDSLRKLYRMPLPPELVDEIRMQVPRLREFVRFGRELLDRPGRPSQDELEQFTARWRRLEAPLGAISDHLQELAADAEANGQRTNAQVRLLMLIGFLGILGLVAFAASRLSRAVLAGNRQLLAATAQAVQADRSRAEFVASMSDEIRSPVGRVQRVVDVLAAEDLQPRQRSYVAALRACAEHLLSVSNDMLDLTRVENGSLWLEEADFSLASLLDELGTQVEPLATERGLVLRMELAPGAPAVLRGDATRLKRVLQNLCSNAVKSTDFGQVCVRVAPVRQEGARWRLRFEVSDTGVGIPAEAMPHLFSALHDADESIARRYRGNGLGLAVCKRLVEIMGGQIGVQSTLGEGSTFHFELVLPQGDAARLPGDPPPPNEPRRADDAAASDEAWRERGLH